MVNQSDACELTVLMPCLNEVETIRNCIQKAQNYLRKKNINGEILIADNGSMDGSQVIAREMGARVVNIEQRGYGSALIGGIKLAKGKYIIMGDADDSYDFEHLECFVEKLREGYDLVMGNRFIGGIKQGAMPFLHQYLGNPVLSFTGRLFFGCGIRDFHCGMRGFKKNAIEQLNLRTTGMEFATEMVVQATVNNLRITEVPTILYKDGRSRKPHLRTWRDGWRHLRFMLLYAPNWVLLYPGLILMVLSGIASVRLLFGPIKIGVVGLDIQTLLFSLLIFFIGFQATNFYIFSKVIAIKQGLLPDKSWIINVSNKFQLEGGLLSGLALILLGLGLFVLAFFKWSEVSFGPLITSNSMRLLIPSTFSIVIGSQIIFSSFLLSLIWIKTK